MSSANLPEPIVLLAEDSEDDAYFFRRAFSKASVGCSLMRAGNGKQAIEILEARMQQSQSLPVLLFLDLKMPVMNGFEVLEWLGSTGLVSNVNVVVLSGSNDQNDRARAARLGAKDYLVKPISAEILRIRVLDSLQSCRSYQLNAGGSS